jgi:hypothetical protein
VPPYEEDYFVDDFRLSNRLPTTSNSATVG